MKQFKGRSVPALYAKILKTILDEGSEVGPRGLKTQELTPVYLEVDRPRERLFGHRHRKEVTIFTYIEGLWMLKAEATPDRLVRYVPAMANFVNEKTGELDGAYGPAINSTGLVLDTEFGVNQWTTAYEKLKTDNDTRQALITINNPLLHTVPTKDYPCTLNFQFLIRNGKLDMISHMRSQDAWLGLIYDTGEFQWFQEVMAGWLGVELGKYKHFVGSMHLYERDWSKADELAISGDKDVYRQYHPEVLDARLPMTDFWNVVESLAKWEEYTRLGKQHEIIDFPENDFYLNLADIIQAYNLRLDGKKEEAYAIVKDNHSDLGRIYAGRWKDAQ